MEKIGNILPRTIFFVITLGLLGICISPVSAYTIRDLNDIHPINASVRNNTIIDIRMGGLFDWLFGKDDPTPTPTNTPRPTNTPTPTITFTPTITPTPTLTPSPTPVEPDYNLLDDVISMFGDSAVSSDTSSISLPEYSTIKVPGLGTYTGTIDNAATDSSGAFFLDNGDILDGTWNEDTFSGLGYLIYTDEGVYEGAVSATVKGFSAAASNASIEIHKNGFGKFTWIDGDMYEGMFSNDDISGAGRYTYSNGSTLTGTFDNKGFITGEFKTNERFYSFSISYEDREPVSVNITLPSGSTFSGSVIDSKISGEGIMEYDDGDIYKGTYKDGKRDGYGNYTWANGAAYSGTWINDTMSGTGVYQFLDGRKLDGIFETNKFVEGTYSYTSEDGITYEYVYEKNISKAKSITLTDESGAVFTGTFTNGSKGNGTINYPNGDNYFGNVDTMIKEGQGTYTWADGSYLKGTWKNDKLEGAGQYYYKKSADAYMLSCSAFKDGVPNGKCLYYVSPSIYYNTDWENGKCVKIYR